MSYSLINDSSVLDIRNAHLRVAGNVEAQAIKVGAVELNAGYSLERTANVGNTTSNTIQFTNEDTSFITSGNVNIGKNLNILYTDNVATIEANSNVVTEFPRSKKLIKYPKVAMTGETTSNHTVTGSSWFGSPALGGSGTQYEPWKAFDNVGSHPTGALAWYSFNYSGTDSYTGTDNTFNPNHGGTATPDLFTGAVQGEWLKIQLPHKVALDHYIMYGPNQESEFPRDWTVYGSVDGTNWVRVDSRIDQIFGAGTGAGGTATGKKKEYQLDTQTGEYLYFAFVFTKASPNRTTYVGVGEIELYGLPEYDPDADGVDVKVTSYPNVPNTDWLEVYYDAKDLTSVSGTIADLSGKSVTGTLNGDVSLDTSNNVKSFSFDGSGDYISGNLTNTGDFDFTVSTWINRNVTGSDHTIWQIGLGSNNNNPNVSTCLSISNEQLDYFIFSGPSAKVLDYADKYPTQTWVHIVCERVGNDLSIFINGIRQQLEYSGTPSDTLSIVSNSTFHIGARTGTQLGVNPMNGKIANFRLFNRALSQDEIYQLYAYQKEYFGHGGLSMTLKAGRLGIGTSEPRAALDVRGDVRFYNVPHIYATDDGGYDAANEAYINFDRVESSYGIALIGTDGTFEITEQAGAGVYYVDGSVSFHQSTGTEVRNLELKIYLNGVSHHSNNRNYGLTAMKHVTGSTYSDLGVTALVKCNVGDKIRLYGRSKSSSINVHTPNNKMVIFKVQST